MKRKFLPILLVMVFLTANIFAQQKQVFISDNSTNKVEMQKKSDKQVVKTPFRPYTPSNSKGVILDESFETDPPTGWTFYELGDLIASWVQTDSHSNNGDYSYYHNDDNGTVASKDWMVTPSLAIDANNYELSFWEYENFDTYYVLHRVVVLDGADPNTANELGELYSAVGTEDTWVKKTFSLAAYNGQTIYIGFYYEGDFKDEWYIDDVTVGCPDPFDASITSIVSPTENFLPGTSDIKVNLANNGTNSFSTCNIEYSVYDVTNSSFVVNPTVYSWNGTALTTGNNVDVTVGNFTSVEGTTYSITATSQLGSDGNSNNDKASTEVSTIPVYSIPYEEDFTAGYPATDWSEAEGELEDPISLSGTTSSWSEDGFANNGYTGSARIEFYLDNKDEWMFTPFIDLGATGIPGAVLKFDIALTDWNSSDPQDDLGADDKFTVIISTDAGATWTSTNTLQTWTNTTSPALRDISSTGEKISLDISSYTGTVQFGFYGESLVSNGDNNLYIDNIFVGVPPNNDASITEIVAPNDGTMPGEKDIVVNLTNLGVYTITTCPITYTVTNSATGDNIATGTYTNWSGSLVNNASENITIPNAFTAESDVTYSITATSNLTDDENANNDVASTEITIQKVYNIPYEEDFTDGYPPADWTEASGLLETSTTLSGTTSSWNEDVFANNGTDGCAKVNIWGTSRKEWMFTPFIDLGATGHGAFLEFDLALTPYGETTLGTFGDDDKFAVIISTDNGLTWSDANDLLTYTSAHTFSLNEHIAIDLANYDGVIQLGFYGESTVSNEDNDLFIDNIVVKKPLSKDLSIEEIAPAMVLYENSAFPEVKIKNKGTESQNNYDVTVSITNATTGLGVYTKTNSFTNTILPEGTYTCIMNTEWTTPATGTYSITATVNLTGDEYTLNNTYTETCIVSTDLYMGVPSDTYTVTTCSATLYDDGGATENYSGPSHQIITIIPSNSSDMSKIEFTDFNISSYSADLRIYDGLDTNATLIGTWNGTDSPGTITAENQDGALTVEFEVTSTYTYAGFAANVSCYTPLTNDASITSINAPTDNFMPGSTDIEVNILNIGINPFSSCDITYTVTNSTTGANDTTATYSWNNGADINIGEDTDIIIPNAFTAESDVTYSITVASNLTGDEDATNDEKSIEVTAAKIYDIPYEQDWTDGYPATDWTEASGELTNNTVLGPEQTGTYASWQSDGFANDGTTGSARLDVYGANTKDWLFTPFINLGATGHGASLEFDLALTSYGETTLGTFGDDDKFAVIISTDGGLTWSDANDLLTYTSTHTFSLNEHVSVDLASYSGIIKLGFYGESTVSNADNDLFVDNVIIESVPNDETDILTYSFAEQTTPAVIDFDAHSIDVEVAIGTDISDLIASFTLSSGATATIAGVTQESGITTNDFTNSVTYNVLAEDGTTNQDWTINVSEEAANGTNILTYSFDEQSAAAIINNTEHTVDIKVVPGTDLSNLTATFTLSTGATSTVGGVAQISGTTSNDFTSPVIYNVVAEDGVINQDWTVNVTVEVSNETNILTYSFDSQVAPASINNTNHTINVVVPEGTDVSGLIATFTLSTGATSTVGGIEQISGTTSNDFSNPVTYNVVAEDGITNQDWTVTVVVEEANGTNILAYSFDEQNENAVIDEDNHTVDIEVVYGTDVSDLIATFSLSTGATVNIGGTEQVSGTTSNDFTSPVTYNVVAEDGSTNQDWTVTVTVAPESVEELNANISIFPNPTYGVITISAKQNYSVTIFDITGKVIAKSEMENNTTDIDISNEQSGLYIILISNENTTNTYKIIKK